MKERRRAGLALTWAIPFLVLLLVLSPAAFGANKKHKPRRHHRRPTPTHTVAPTPTEGPSTTPAASQGGTVFSVSGDVDVPKAATVADVLVVRGNVTVEGTVNGDIFVVSGSITVAGDVIGSTISITGPVTLKSTAVVSGDAISGGAVSQASGAKLAGRVKQNYSFTLNGLFGRLGALLAGLMIVFSAALLGFGMLFLAPRSADRIAQVGRADPFQSAVFGVLATVALPVIAAISMATIVGVPLGLAILLSMVLLYLLGFTWTIWIAGRAVLGPPRSRALAFGSGLAVAAAISVVPSLNLAVWILGSIFGVGAMTQSLWRGRKGASAGAAEPAAAPRPARPSRAAPAKGVATAAEGEEEVGVAEPSGEEAGAAGDIPGLAPRPKPAGARAAGAAAPAAQPGDVPGLAPRPKKTVRPPRTQQPQPSGETAPSDPEPLAGPEPLVAPPRRQMPRLARQDEQPSGAPAGGPALPPPPPMPAVDDEGPGQGQ